METDGVDLLSRTLTAGITSYTATVSDAISTILLSGSPSMATSD